jgi:hypothetical protein
MPSELFSEEQILPLKTNKSFVDIGFEDMRKRVPNIDKISKFIKWVPQRNLNNIITDIAKNISRET